MKRAVIVSLLAGLVAFGLACTPAGERVDPDETVLDDIEESREELVSTTEAELDALESDMNELKERIESSGEEAAAELDAEVDSWEREYQDIERRLETAQVESREELNELETEIDQSIMELRRKFSDMSSRITAGAR